MKPQRRAFTLIELLVVIAIIAVLAGILFPVFSRARDRASQAQCLSNLRQLGMAVMNYQEDWNGRFPFAIDYADREYISAWYQWQNTNYNWIPNAGDNVRTLSSREANDGSPFGGQIDRVLRPYTTSDGIWRCPGDTGIGGIGYAATPSYAIDDVDRNTPVWKITRGSGTWGGTSYSYRTELALRMKPVTSLLTPSSINVFQDFSVYWHSRLHRAPRAGEDEWTDYYAGSRNVLFADSHVMNLSTAASDRLWYNPAYPPTRRE